MIKICLTGGPSGGKSSCIVAVKAALEQAGYSVSIVEECATKLIKQGYAIGQNISIREFQKLVFALQLQTEKALEAEAKNRSEKAVMICDRGFMDQCAYLAKSEMLEIAKEHGMAERDMLLDYDAVVHLVTAAIGTDCYTTANNAARKETAEEAVRLDRATLAAWQGHDHLYVIDNSTDFPGKVQRVVHTIYRILGI